jgi:hypothetical protein
MDGGSDDRTASTSKDTVGRQGHGNSQGKHPLHEE